jgi:hypothetical protein
MLKRNRAAVLVGLAALVGSGTLLVLAAYLVRHGAFDSLDGGMMVVQNHYAGWTKGDVIGHLGPPSTHSDGHSGDPPLDYARQHSPAITFTYFRPAGTLYLSFEQVNGEWVCFSSDWLPKGAAF